MDMYLQQLREPISRFLKLLWVH